MRIRSSSKKYLLRGTDDEKVRDLFRHDVLDVFEDIEGVSVEGLRDQSSIIGADLGLSDCFLGFLLVSG